MKKLALSLILCLLYVVSIANDGVFFATGNQLIPITETDIRVKKEILTVNRVGNHLEVTVYYEFFNPVGEKDLLVGFEAPAAYPPEERYLDAFPNQPHCRMRLPMCPVFSTIWTEPRTAKPIIIKMDDSTAGQNSSAPTRWPSLSI